MKNSPWRVTLSGHGRTPKFGATGWTRAQPGLHAGSVTIVASSVTVTDLHALVPAVKITEIMPGKPAANSGSLAKGDLIREVNGKEVASYAKLTELLDAARGREVELTVTSRTRVRVIKVLLNRNGPPLGIVGEVVWTQGGVPTAPPVNLKPPAGGGPMPVKP